MVEHTCFVFVVACSETCPTCARYGPQAICSDPSEIVHERVQQASEKGEHLFRAMVEDVCSTLVGPPWAHAIHSLSPGPSWRGQERRSTRVQKIINKSSGCGRGYYVLTCVGLVWSHSSRAPAIHLPSIQDKGSNSVQTRSCMTPEAAPATRATLV